MIFTSTLLMPCYLRHYFVAIPRLLRLHLAPNGRNFGNSPLRGNIFSIIFTFFSFIFSQNLSLPHFLLIFVHTFPSFSLPGTPVKNELIVGETAAMVIRVSSRQDATKRLSSRQDASTRVYNHQDASTRVYDHHDASTRVTSCVAHDGSGEQSQELIDGDGCPVEEEIMPELR